MKRQDDFEARRAHLKQMSDQELKDYFWKLAQQVVDPLLELGYRVPEDVSLVGYDDWLYPGMCDVPITTYSVDMPRMAETGIDMLVRRIEGDDSRCNMQIIEGEIVIRNSVRSLVR